MVKKNSYTEKVLLVLSNNFQQSAHLVVLNKTLNVELIRVWGKYNVMSLD